MYYGNAGAANQQNVNAVWDANFRGVWHLVEAPANGVAGTFDSTSGNFTGTPQGFADGVPGSTNAVGIVSGADNFLTDTYNVPAGNTVNRVEVPDNAVLRPNGDFTIEAWANFLSPTFDQFLVYKWNTANFAYQLMVGNNGGPVAAFQRLNTAPPDPSSMAPRCSRPTPGTTSWGSRAAATSTSTSTATWRARSAESPGTSTQTNPLALVIGATYFGSGGLNGREDEVRFSDSARSANVDPDRVQQRHQPGGGGGKVHSERDPGHQQLRRQQHPRHVGRHTRRRPVRDRGRRLHPPRRHPGSERVCRRRHHQLQHRRRRRADDHHRRGPAVHLGDASPSTAPRSRASRGHRSSS